MSVFSASVCFSVSVFLVFWYECFSISVFSASVFRYEHVLVFQCEFECVPLLLCVTV